MLVFRGFSFRNKLIVSFLLVSLLPVLIVQMISYMISTEAMKNKIDDLVHVNLLQTSKNLDTSLQAYEDILFQIFTNDDVVALVQKINTNEADLELNKRKLIDLLSNYSYAKTGIRSVAIFTSNGTLICYDQQSGSPFENLWSGIADPTRLPLYEKAINLQNKNVITSPMKINPINNKEQYGFHIARKLIDYNKPSLVGIGVAVITVYESVLATAINLNDPESYSSPQMDNQNFLTDRDDRIVSSSEKQTIGMFIRDVTKKPIISNAYFNEKSGLRIYNQIDQNDLFREMYSMQRLTLISGILALLVSGILIYYFSGSLSKSIRKVVRAMKAAQQGTLTVQVEGHHTGDEISAVAFSFNKMMNTVNELMIETKHAVEKQKEAEIRALEAQINPHFLYNTLDSINWLAIDKEEHQISQMLKGLAQILRYSVKDSNKWVTVKEELEWMDQYVFLQQYRFRSSFQCVVEHDDRTLGFQIHKLLLQPFIENSIIHGFVGRKQGGLLRISVSILDISRFTIVIEDNGIGMDEVKKEALLSGTDKGLSNGSGLGVHNVFERLRMYYGNEASYEINSVVGQGTIIRLVLPILTEGEDHS